MKEIICNRSKKQDVSCAQDKTELVRCQVNNSSLMRENDYRPWGMKYRVDEKKKMKCPWHNKSASQKPEAKRESDHPNE